MVLVDTSVWVNHLRKSEKGLNLLLADTAVLCHPYVVGELACGTMRNRREVLMLLQNLPQSTTAQPQEVLFFIENHNLMGRGIGYIDAHLLASVTLQAGATLWTLDKRMAVIAEELRISYKT